MSRFASRVRDAVGTALFVVLMIGFLLGVGWFVGFRPIEWVIEYGKPKTAVDGPSERPVEVVDDVEVEQPPPPPDMRWRCFWDPTMNEDWHDDVLCSNGVAHERPYLLADWSFVTEDDMLAAAADYESYLNGR